MAVRTRAGLFDVSHMGQIESGGEERRRGRRSGDLQRCVGAEDRPGEYPGLLTPGGTFVDDVLVYRMAPATSCSWPTLECEEGLAWISEQIKAVGDAAAVDSSSRYALLALQGPASRGGLPAADRRGSGRGAAVLVRTTGKWPMPAQRFPGRATAARTGSRSRTAEHGRPSLAGGARIGPGGRRDSVRPRRTRHASPRSGDAPLRERYRRVDDGPRGGLEWTIAWNKKDFIGRDVWSSRGTTASRGGWSGLEMVDRGIARHGYPVVQRRPADRRGHKRHADTVSEEGDRDGVCSAGTRGTWT